MTWAHEVKNYENDKRRILDEGFLRPKQINIAAGSMKHQERVFDPLLQRYRDSGVEHKQRLMEETERVNHLNRAMDIQVVREQPFHILRHESKFDNIAPGQDPVRHDGHDKPRKAISNGAYPDTQQDFNIVSNLPHDTHHWNRPDLRPRHNEREGGKQRMVAAHRVRDFNILSNRYKGAPGEHEARVAKEAELNIMEAAHKHMKKNRFDPLAQQYNDPRHEESAKHCDDARDVEVRLRAEAMIPPSHAGRVSQFHDIVSNKVHDADMVKHLDALGEERKDRYRNRYIVEHNFHAQDLKGDHLKHSRKLNRVAPERFMQEDHGYCIVTNKGHGHGPKEKRMYAACAPPRKTPWEEVMHGHEIHAMLNERSASTPSLAPVAVAQDLGKPAAAAATPASSRYGAQPAATPGASQRGLQPAATLAASQRSLGGHGALSEAGSRTLSNASSRSAANLREPPGMTRPIPRSSSTPVLQASPAPADLPMSAVRTQKLPPPTPAFSASLSMTRAPAAPMIPGSPMGSVYSRPSAKAC